MKKRARKKTYIALVLILLVGIIGIGIWYLTRNVVNTSNSLTDTELESVTKDLSALGEWAPTGTLVYSSSNQIVYASLNKDIAQKYTSEAKSFSTQITDDGKVMLLTQSDELILWKEGATKKIIAKESVYNPLPVPSPDGEKMLAIEFSNAERDYGYSMQVLSVSEKYLSTAATTQSRIVAPCWASDSTIIYGVLSAGGSEIYSTNVDGTSTDLLWKSDGKFVVDITAEGNTILFTSSDNQGNDTLVHLYKINNSEAEEISENSGVIREITLSPDSEAVSFINSDGNIVFENIETRDSKSIGSASHILGWY